MLCRFKHQFEASSLYTFMYLKQVDIPDIFYNAFTKQILIDFPEKCPSFNLNCQQISLVLCD